MTVSTPTPSPPGSPDATAILAATVARGCAMELGAALRGVILTGSLARGEATWTRQGGRTVLAGDADFLLILADRHSSWPAARLWRLGEKLRAALHAQALECRLTLHAGPARYLRRLPPRIFSYELKTCGQVVWGEPDLLGLIPPMTVAEIPLEDGWRLLNNRLIEQLAFAATGLEPGARYALVKLYLDMACSLLLFAGRYQPSYQARTAALSEMAARPPAGWSGPDLAALTALVAQATEVKLAGRPLAEFPPDAEPFPEAAARRARELWRWELERLLGEPAPGPFSDGDLLARWMRREPLQRRLRGWLVVARAAPWPRAWRSSAAWIWHAPQASPRSWIYRAATELFFAAGQAPAQPAFLPVAWLPAARSLSPRERARQIIWNYRHFLENTRA